MARNIMLLRSLSSSLAPTNTCQTCVSPLLTHAQSPLRHFQTATVTLSSPKFKIREHQPPGWRHSADQAANRKAYNSALSEYNEQVAALRNAWRTRVAQHNQVLAKRKAQRDTARVTQQRDDLRRQLARWVAPEEMRDLAQDLDSFGQQQQQQQQQEASAATRGAPAQRELTEKEREKAVRVEAQQQADAARRSARMTSRYSRHAMTVHLAQVSRVAQAELLLRESGQWASESDVDEAIERALDNPVDIFAPAEAWSRGLEGVPEYVQGFEGPQAEQGLPEHVKRRMRGK
eukprot:jgi/Ulvmu1/10787/UM069_0021.1